MVLQSTLLALLACLLPYGWAFIPVADHQNRRTTPPRALGMAEITTTTSSSASNPTLTEETTWKLRFVLRGVSTAKRKKVDEIFVISGSFVEEEGYEPPQGSFVQKIDSAESEGPTRLKLAKSRWQLSEDPNDRKDGLWVWGLFKEPLYPFMLLKLETESIPLSGSDDDSILPLQLFAQVDHRRDDAAVILGATTELKVRQMETVQADLFGVATADIYQEVSVGSLSIQPVASKS